MGFFTNLESQNVFRLIRPFNSIRDIRWRAEQILKKKKRTPEQLEFAAKGIQDSISEYKDEKIAEEVERYIQRLYEQGGWELGYLQDFENDRQPGMDEIRDLLEHWPHWANDKPDIPNGEDICDLHALQDILCSGFPYDDIEGFPGATEAECYAVLALMKLDHAIGFLVVQEKLSDKGIVIHPINHQWEAKDVIDSGNIIVDAMEIICYAERELSNSQLNKLRDEQRERMDAEREAERARQFDFSAIGKDGADKRHAPMRKLRYWTIIQYRALKEKHQKKWEECSTPSGKRKVYKPLSASNAAHTLMDEVMTYGNTINAILQASNAQRTIAEWIRDSV